MQIEWQNNWQTLSKTTIKKKGNDKITRGKEVENQGAKGKRTERKSGRGKINKNINMQMKRQRRCSINS